ncbi:MAG: signal peptidase I [Clostridia bacterium]|nr:signal peptidase I [Clostridia bacterium]
MSNSKPDFTEETAGQMVVSALYDVLDIVVPALLVVSLIFLFFLRTAGVDGESMQDTLQNNDRLIMVNFLYEPQRGDIVIINRFHKGDTEIEEPLIKRVIGVAGDTVRVEPTAVYLNDVKLDEPYVNYLNLPYGITETVPEGCVFVLGDHRNNSRDSREFGCFPVEELMGKAVWRIFPTEDFGGIYDNLLPANE